MWGDWGMGWGGWSVLGMVNMLIWWVLVVLGIAVLLKWLFGGPPRRERTAENRALDILKERYARGEINKEEFEQKKRDLT